MCACRAIIYSYFGRQTGWVVRRDELRNVSSNANVWRGSEVLWSTTMALLLVFVLLIRQRLWQTKENVPPSAKCFMLPL